MTYGSLAIIAGSGGLPLQLSQACSGAVCVVFNDMAHHLTGPVQTARFEKLGTLFETLKAAHITQVVFAGAMQRPPLDPSQFDAKMMTLAPRLMGAMQGGDDAILRLVVSVFEEEGFEVLGAHELIPDLTAPAGLLAGPAPSAGVIADIDRGFDILAALAPVDVGQGVVVSGGLCLGIETLQGTQALLEFVAQTDPALRGRAEGVLVKLPKAGQELRVDMPVIGPDTIAQLAEAGLSGIVIAAGQVLLLERAALIQAAQEAGIFILARAV